MSESKAQEHGKTGLSPDEFRGLKLIKRTVVSHDTSEMHFALADPKEELNLPVTSFVLIKAKINNEDVIRPYTPIKSPTGTLVLIVKHYEAGNVSKYLKEVNVGDEVSFKGPLRKLQYKQNMTKKIGLVAGGTGLTPMLQVAQQIIDDAADTTEIYFLYCNKSVDDILLRQQLDELAANNKQLTLEYMLDKNPEDPKFSSNFNGKVGYVTEDIIKESFPGPNEDCMVMVCGPPPMYKAICGPKAPDKSQGELGGFFAKLGYKKEQVFKF